MIDEILMKAVIDTIPQWYTAKHGPHQYKLLVKHKLSVKYSHLCFYSHTPLSPKLQKFYEYANKSLPKWKRTMSISPLAVHVDFVQAILALKWLDLFDPKIDWRELFLFIRNTGNRSYENHPVALNLIISPGKGKVKITNPDFNKFLDPLANSQQVFLRIDKQLNFLDYEEISWTKIKETEDNKFSPDFLQPIASVLKKGEISVHLTSCGDIIFMNSDGIIASRRKQFWHFYDVFNFSESMIKLFKNNRAGKLLETMLDLSYKRRGALIVFDPNCTVIKQLVSTSSSACAKYGTPDLFRSMLSKSFFTPDNATTKKPTVIRKKRLFLEIASIDGAVVCNNEGIMAFGAMIKPHPNVRSHPGARTTAAESAYRWGGIALSVSADGDISIYFESPNKVNKCDAVITFM